MAWPPQRMGIGVSWHRSANVTLRHDVRRNRSSSSHSGGTHRRARRNVGIAAGKLGMPPPCVAHAPRSIRDVGPISKRIGQGGRMCCRNEQEYP